MVTTLWSSKTWEMLLTLSRLQENLSQARQ